MGGISKGVQVARCNTAQLHVHRQQAMHAISIHLVFKHLRQAGTISATPVGWHCLLQKNACSEPLLGWSSSPACDEGLLVLDSDMHNDTCDLASHLAGATLQVQLQVPSCVNVPLPCHVRTAA